jgi:valyl-tRNA synthetase
VDKRIGGMMQPHLAEKITQQTRADFPEGIPAFGTDALRFTFAALAATGRDIKFDLNRIEGYRNFCNKLWNAARYVFLNTEGEDCGQLGGEQELSVADRWILSRLQATTQAVSDAIGGYRFDHAAQALYEFTWNEYCDWYLELCKPVLTDAEASAAAKRGSRRTLVQVLESLLRLAHPIMPFITEEIWQKAKPLAGVSGDTIMSQPFPVSDATLIDAEAVAEMEWVMQLVLGVRRIKGEMNIAPGKPLAVLLQHASERDRAWLQINRRYLDFLARLESVTVLEEDAEAPESATALVGQMKVLIPMAGLIDKEAELARLDKELARRRQELERTQGKLHNPHFVDKAPAAVVEKEKARLKELGSAIHKLEEQLAKIQTL